MNERKPKQPDIWEAWADLNDNRDEIAALYRQRANGEISDRAMQDDLQSPSVLEHKAARELQEARERQEGRVAPLYVRFRRKVSEFLFG